MIPASTNQLGAVEDWTKIYQSFKNAEFKSYDFDTLRRTMVSYLQTNYPEDFNDYVDSSEYLALVELIAFLGQNISFRVDLNARENLLETATQRDSILRLAQLVSFNPARNIPASGLLQVTAISTTENIQDSVGNNLANQVIAWNDSTNPSWYQQFITIINASLESGTSFGKPTSSANLNGIETEQYPINSSNTDVPLFVVNKSINGIQTSIELVSSSLSSGALQEVPPRPGNPFSLIYQNDFAGTNSPNNGFFVYFRQGQLGSTKISFTNPLPNELIGVNVNNINNEDVWLWQLDANGNFSSLWEQIPSVVGTNAIYNSLATSLRNVYAVTTRGNDQIDLNFADGSFGNIPSGNFILYYRQSNGLNYSIKPSDMTGIQVQIPYLNLVGQKQTLTLTLSLQYTVSNSSGAQSNDDIKRLAPQNYYTQNRMITGEDYNILPLTISNSILKVKSINRVSSGISRYFELSDVTGEYSTVEVLATDGIIYLDELSSTLNLVPYDRNQTLNFIRSSLYTQIGSQAVQQFYLKNYPRIDLTSQGLHWVNLLTTNGQSQGYIADGSNNSIYLSGFASGLNSFIQTGSQLQFLAPAGKYFDATGKLVSTASDSTTSYYWSAVQKIQGDGTTNTAKYPVTMTDGVPNSVNISQVIPPLPGSFSQAFELSIVNFVFTKRNFGLSFNNSTRVWGIITDANIDLTGNFNLANQGDITNSNRDSSWLVAFKWNGTEYEVIFRGTRYYFRSIGQTGFYYDKTATVYDFSINRLITDSITVLSNNSSNFSGSLGIGLDFEWEIVDSLANSQGYRDTSGVEIQIPGGYKTPIDPDSFNRIVNVNKVDPATGFLDSFVFFDISTGSLVHVLSSSFVIVPNIASVTGPITDQNYFFYETDSFSVWTGSTWNTLTNFVAYSGREGIKFQYQHNADQDQRIDPTPSNLIDIYLLTSDYDQSYRTWVSSGGTEPTPPTNQTLLSNYGSLLEPYRSVSDSLLFQSARYRPLFGKTADPALQARFKLIQSITSTLGENELINKTLTAINEFFGLANWDFGQTFNFSELSAYVMNSLSGDLSNFLIVPVSNNQVYGSLQQINCASNEILISTAGFNDIDVIQSLTSSAINAGGAIITTT